MNKINYYIFAMLLVSGSVTFAQTERCTQDLEEAQLRYDEGRIQDVEELVLSCLDQGIYDKAQSVQALRLMILSNIFMEQGGKADTLMLRLLKKDHEFVPDPILDPTEFINLYNSYRTDPVFNIGVKFGQNWSMTDVNNLHTVGQPGTTKEYKIINGLHVGLLFEWEFKPRWILYPEIDYSSRIYRRLEDYSGLISGETYSNSDITETFTWIEVPVTVQFILVDKPLFKPYVFMGGSVSYLISSSYSGDLSFRDRKNNSQVKLSTVNSTEDRNRINANAIIGGGIKYKIGPGYVTAEVRVAYQITQLTIDANGLSPTEPDLVHGLWEWYDSFNQHYAAATVGYTLNIYKPKKNTIK